MQKRDPRAKGMPWLSPYLFVSDAQKAIDFYQNAFGFEKLDAAHDDHGNITHVEMKHKDAVIMFAPTGAYGQQHKSPAASGHPIPISLYIYCDDVDKLYARAVENGAKSETEPQEMFWGDRMCALLDPDGYQWCFATNVGEHQHPE